MPQLDRSGSISLPVIVGLVAGIAFIVVIVMALKFSESKIDDDLRMMIANEYPQFQALKDRYPNVLEQFERGDSMTLQRGDTPEIMELYRLLMCARGIFIVTLTEEVPSCPVVPTPPAQYQLQTMA